MRLTRLAFVLAALAAPSMLAPSAAFAYIAYPWCAIYNGRGGGGGTNCGFSTWRQCMDTISGVGGTCEPNQFYPGPDKPRVRHLRKRAHR